MMSNLMSKTIVATALALGVCSAAPAGNYAYYYPAQFQAARAKCEALTGTEQARCIVNIQPTPAAPEAASVSSNSTVKGDSESDEAQALKMCEHLTGAVQQQCMVDAKERQGKM